MQASLHIPAFTKGKDHLYLIEIEETRTIGNVRIHVEWVIGMVRQKYSILHGTMPIYFLIRRAGKNFPLIECIVFVVVSVMYLIQLYHLINICIDVKRFQLIIDFLKLKLHGHNNYII